MYDKKRRGLVLLGLYTVSSRCSCQWLVVSDNS